MKHFEILNKLNQLDTENGTSFVGICHDVIAVDKKGHNGEVKIGIPGHVAQELVLSNMKNKSLQLLIIDIAEYEAIKAGGISANAVDLIRDRIVNLKLSDDVDNPDERVTFAVQQLTDIALALLEPNLS